MNPHVTAAAGALLERLRLRDPAEAAHALACAASAEQTATALGLEDRAVARCANAALLHDIGMLEVPAVRQRFGIPSDAEWKLILAHPVHGERIIRQFPELDEIARLVRAHHERIDGSGYPDRLRGDSIPIESRVIAVVDAFHAMTTADPFRRVFSASDALAELLGNCGTQFDTDVVEAFAASNGRRARRLQLVVSA